MDLTERTEREVRPAPWPTAATPSDPKHEAYLQSVRVRRLAQLDTALGVSDTPVDPLAGEVSSGERTPADTFQDEMPLPGSVVM